MSTEYLCAITSDIDTLASIYKGQGCNRKEGYTYSELQMGLENFCRFLEQYGIKSTLFMVGNDFNFRKNHGIIKEVVNQGHEIANHTLSHFQGFRFLSQEHKEAEIAGMEEACYAVTGKKPVGFRSPGWNMSDDTLTILKGRGYIYDSSVFPTSLMPLLKFLHWYSMRGREGVDRHTMGLLKYMAAPTEPYRTNGKSFGKRGNDNFVEFPIAVTPILRLPFFATFLLGLGISAFNVFYRSLKFCKRNIQFQFHLSDFVDYSHPDLSDQVPLAGCGQYVPKALYTPLDNKLSTFSKAIDIIAKDYSFLKLEDWAKSILPAYT